MTDEMDHPVTRRELREELAKHPTREEMHEALAIWAQALEDRIVTRVTAQVTAHTSAEIARHVTASEERLRTEMSREIGQHVTASEERIRADMRAILDPHHAMPDRVTGLEARVERLEAKVLAPKRARRRPSR